jgi:hypothetical protein
LSPVGDGNGPVVVVVGGAVVVVGGAVVVVGGLVVVVVPGRVVVVGATVVVVGAAVVVVSSSHPSNWSRIASISERGTSTVPGVSCAIRVDGPPASDRAPTAIRPINVDAAAKGRFFTAGTTLSLMTGGSFGNVMTTPKRTE